MLDLERFEWRGLFEGLDPIPEAGTILVLEREHIAARAAELEKLAEEFEGLRVGVTRERRKVWREAAAECRERAAKIRERGTGAESLSERVERLEAELVDAEAAVERKRNEDGP